MSEQGTISQCGDTEACRQSQVCAGTELLDETIGVLSDRAEALIARLRPVVRDVPTACETEKACEQLVPVADELRIMQKRIATISDAIHLTLENLEL